MGPAAMIAEGQRLLDRSLVATDGVADPYQLQAAIAACHDQAPTFEATDWPEIAAALRHPRRHPPQPDGRHQRGGRDRARRRPRRRSRGAGRGGPGGSRPCVVDARRGELLEQAGRYDEAQDAFCAAATVAPSGPEQRHLECRVAAAGTARP